MPTNKLKTTYVAYFKWVKSGDNVVGVVSRIRTGRPINLVSIPGKLKRFSCTQNPPPPVGPTQPHTEWVPPFCPEDKTAAA